MNSLAASSETAGSKRKISPETIEDKVMREWSEAQDSPSNESLVSEWIDWSGIEHHVFRLQRQLANAVEHRNRKAARHYKWLIRNSRNVRMLAIRTVTQENKGRKTPGVDGKTYMTPEARKELLELVSLRKNPLPVRRVYIKKKNGKQRPLGIPSIHDRVCQAIH
jgi:RNA-directed DNA polymerase